jgi:hypothetical protein
VGDGQLGKLDMMDDARRAASRAGRARILEPEPAIPAKAVSGALILRVCGRFDAHARTLSGLLRVED